MPPLMTQTQVSLKNIAVATDFSANAAAALDYANAMAVLHNIRVFLVHALQPEAMYGQAAGVGWRRVRGLAEAQLQRESAKLADVRHELCLEEGDVVDVVQRVANTHDIDLLVVGAQGQGGSKPTPGSVAQRIFRQAGCPVLTIGPNLQHRDSTPEWTKILFPSDLLDSHAAAYTTALAKEHAASVSLLHVLQGAEPPRHKERNWMREIYRDAMHRLVPAGSHIPIPPDFLVVFGKDPIGIVLEVARELPADLIVLGVGHDEIYQLHPHDRAGRIVAQATCPVLTIAERRVASNEPLQN